jgi:hypothetical protein
VQPGNYPDQLKVKDALGLYFSLYHFKDGGYHDKWFRIKLGRIFIPLPNIKARVDAVKIHDIHHLVTEYKADWKGETEIAAWEIASGCERYSVAWLLNLGSFFIGLLRYPRPVLKAFIRGRKCATNLYFRTTYNEALLNKTLGELRGTIGIDVEKNVNISDYGAFGFWCAIAVLYHTVIGLAFIYVLYMLGSSLVRWLVGT